MFTPVLRAILTVLVLMPPGVCACDGGPRACPNHPSPVERHDCDSGHCGDGHRGGAEDEQGLDHAGAGHRCPAPVPHHPSCPAVTPAADQAAAERVWPSAAPDLLTAPFVVPFSRQTHVRPARPIRVTTSSPPLFIAHCALLI